MSQASEGHPTSQQNDPGSLEAARKAADRSSTWMVAAMVVCCATIPIGLLVAAVAGGLDVSAVSTWSWLLLAAAIGAATTMIVRVARGPRPHAEPHQPEEQP